MLNGIFQRPYLNKDGRSLVKRKQDEEQNASYAQREQQTDENSRSKGLQYVEQRKPSYTPAYQQVNNNGEQQVDWRQMRSQIQSQAQSRNLHPTAQSASQTQEIIPSKMLSGKSTVINIAQILKDFRNTTAAIGTGRNTAPGGRENL